MEQLYSDTPYDRIYDHYRIYDYIQRNPLIWRDETCDEDDV